MIRARLLMQQDGDFLGAVRICQTIMAWIPFAGNFEICYDIFRLCYVS